MKWSSFLLVSLVMFTSYAQETNSTDSVKVNSLLRSSRAFQWVDPYRSLNEADQALKLSRKIDFKKGIAIANNLRGFCFWSFGDNDLAIEAAMEALAVGELESDLSIQAESYYILARGYMDLNEGAKANECIDKSESLAKSTHNYEQLCSIYNLKGVIKFIENQKDSALYYYSKAYSLGKEHAVDPINFPRIISNIGECNANPTKALEYFNEALSLARKTNNKIAEASITAIIGQWHIRANNLNTAEEYLQTSLALARQLGLRRVIRHAYAGLVDIRRKQGRADEAVVYQEQYYAVRDSLLNTSKMRQIVELEAKHEMQLKEQQLQLLESEKRLQTIWKNLLIGLVVFVLVLFSALYQLQRYRYTKNREMLNLEIDYLTHQHKETVDKYKASLVKEPQSIESHDQKILKKAIGVVEAHLSDSQFSVEMMAEEMNMSRTNLHRKLKAITGFPPSELIRSIRLRKAAKLILNKVDSVTQIALMVGFEDYSHFSKAFKKHFGVSPSAYEDEAAARQQLAEELGTLKGE